MPLLPWNWKALALLPLLVGNAFAQALTNATCGVQFGWMNNGLGQSPCLVAAYLAGVCNNGSWMILALDGVDSYGAPSGEIATPCECNTVFYNLIEACSACQLGSIGQWEYWIQNCPQTYIGKTFPYPIPAGTQVPAWAYMDPSAVGFWSPTIASSYAVGPSASITPGSASPSPTSTQRPTTVFVQVTQSPIPSPTNRSASTPVGAIAGGVVGGVILLIVIGLGIWFSCFREQREPQQMQNDMRSPNIGGMYGGALPGQMFAGPATPGSTAPLQQPQPAYRVYAPSAQNPSNPTINHSSPSSNHDVPPQLLDADPTRQSFYPQHIAHQSLGQFSSGSPQASPPLEPITNATCNTRYTWMNNALGQSPCLVSAYLADACNDGSWTIPALHDDYVSYSAPAGELVTPCQCNTVFYNLIQACSTCQLGVIDQWQYWIQNCPQTYISTNYPYPIPTGTQVPTWAYMDLTAVGFWSPSMASSYAVGPSASITPFSTSPSPTSTAGPTTVYVSVTPTPSETRRSASSTPVGAIVGGVVGGVALLVAIGFGIWFCCMRKPRQPQQMQEDMRPSNAGAMYNGALPGQMSPTTPGSQGTTAFLQPPQPHYPFYSPSAQNPSNLAVNQSSPSSNYDVPHLDADSMAQSFYPNHVARQSFGQFSSASPQASPPLEPSTFAPPGVQRNLSLAPSYRTSQFA